MSGKRQPTALLEANGRKHLTVAEADARRDREVVVPAPQKAKPPKWLLKGLHKEFRALGRQLIDVGLYTDLDADNLGRYLTAHHEYQIATLEVERALGAPERDADTVERWGRVQERYFKQARNCANDMGLTVSSRCRLVLPTGSSASAPEGGADEFTERLRQRQADAMARSV